METFFSCSKEAMKDLSLIRSAPEQGFNKIQGSPDGLIFIKVKNGFSILTPKNDLCNSTKVNKVSDIYNWVSIKLESRENFFSQLAHDNVPKFCEFNEHTENLKLQNLSISDFGVSRNFKSCYLFNTDSNNGYIYDFDNNQFNYLCCINEYLIDIFNVDLTPVCIKESEMNKLRITYMRWMKSVKVKHLKNPIFPIDTGSMFFCLNKTKFVTILKYNSVINTVTKIESLELELSDGEYPIYCEQSDWIEKNNEEQYFYIGFVTNYNKIVVKKFNYNISERRITVCNDFTKTFKVENNYIVQFKISCIRNRIVLTNVLIDKVEFYDIETEEGLFVDFEDCIAMENVVLFEDVKNDNIVHCLFVNSFGGLKYIDVDVNEFKIVKDVNYDYFKKIENEELPIFRKINSINNFENSSIDSISLDTTGKLIYLTFKKISLKSKLVFKNTAKECILFNVVKIDDNASIEFEDLNKFNSIFTSPRYIKSLKKLIEDDRVESEMDVDNVGANEKGGSLNVVKTEEMEIFNEECEEKGIFEEIFLSQKKFEEIKVQNILTETGIDLENKLQIQKVVANKTLDMLKKHKIEMKTEEDKIIYLQYKKLLGELLEADNYLCKMQVYGIEDLYETFDISSANMVDGKIESVEGNRWKVCEVTFLPILQPEMLQCENCGSTKSYMKTADAEEDTAVCQVPGIQQYVSAETAICVYCGSRYRKV